MSTASHALDPDDLEAPTARACAAGRRWACEQATALELASVAALHAEGQVEIEPRVVLAAIARRLPGSLGPDELGFFEQKLIEAAPGLATLDAASAASFTRGCWQIWRWILANAKR